jgi:hypothetical protein
MPAAVIFKPDEPGAGGSLMARAACALTAAFLVLSCEANPLDPGAESAIDRLIAALRQQGPMVVLGETLPQRSNPFFSVSAQRLLVNGESVSVFEYPTAAAANGEAALVSGDGSPIGQTQITWIVPPRFYKSDRLIVLYVGSESAVVRALDAVLGPPFAGA